ncbi:MAG: hypothetical protein ACPGVB_08200 [Chitinophagales bacterium]
MKVFVFLSILSLGFFTSCTSKMYSSASQNEEIISKKEVVDTFSEGDEEEMVDVTLITDVLGLDKKITVKVKKKEGILKPLKFTDQTKYYIGILNYNLGMKPQSSLKLLSWEIPMTEIGIMEAREPSPLIISEFDIGKLAIVHGYSDGGTMYFANIVAVFEQKPMALLMELLNEEDFDLEVHVRKDF